MKDRVTVTIGGQKYTFLAAEEEGYVEKVAAYVDGKLKEIAKMGRMSAVDSAILASMNIAEEKFREQESSEHLRAKILELQNELAGVRTELSECKREIFRLQNRR